MTFSSKITITYSNPTILIDRDYPAQQVPITEQELAALKFVGERYGKVAAIILLRNMFPMHSGLKEAKDGIEQIFMAHGWTFAPPYFQQSDTAI